MAAPCMLLAVDLEGFERRTRGPKTEQQVQMRHQEISNLE
jgi:hypothetical protein